MELITGDEAKKAFNYAVECGCNNRCYNCGEKVIGPIIVVLENEKGEPVQTNFCSVECAKYITLVLV